MLSKLPQKSIRRAATGVLRPGLITWVIVRPKCCDCSDAAAGISQSLSAYCSNSVHLWALVQIRAQDSDIALLRS